MDTKIPLQVDEITNLTVVAEIPTGTTLKHFLYLDGTQYAHNGTAWAVMDSTTDLAPQANTVAEINTNLAALITQGLVVKGIGKTVKIGHVFVGNAGYGTPLIESLTLKYSYTFSEDDITLCTVTTVVKNNAAQVVEGAKCIVTSSDRFLNNNFLGPNALVTSNAQGKISVSVPETASANVGVTFEIHYTETVISGGVEVTKNRKFKYKNRIVPAQATARMEDLVAV